MGGGELAHRLCKTHTWTRIILQYLFIVRFIFRYVFLFLRLSAQCSATQHTFLFPQNVECISIVEQKNHRKKKYLQQADHQTLLNLFNFFFFVCQCFHGLLSFIFHLLLDFVNCIILLIAVAILHAPSFNHDINESYLDEQQLYFLCICEIGAQRHFSI